MNNVISIDPTVMLDSVEELINTFGINVVEVKHPKLAVRQFIITQSPLTLKQYVFQCSVRFENKDRILDGMIIDGTMLLDDCTIKVPVSINDKEQFKKVFEYDLRQVLEPVIYKN